jgi:hypothetical protein
MMLSEGRREIKANEQRLAAANARAAAATKTLESAQQMLEIANKNVESARENLDSSNEEVKAAEAQLKEACERWPVIEVDDADDEVSAAAALPKRRKVSASPSKGVHTNVRQNDAPADTPISIPLFFSSLTATASQSSSGAGAIRTSSRVFNAAATIPASNGDNSDSLVVVVEGCGLSEVNGTFERSANKCDGVTIYKKKGQWMGKCTEYEIYRHSRRWWISVKNDTSRKNLSQFPQPQK